MKAIAHPAFSEEAKGSEVFFDKTSCDHVRGGGGL